MKRKPVKSASRTFEVLELFRERRQPLRLNEIYSALGYPQSSTTNLLTIEHDEPAQEHGDRGLSQL